jgi:hypothetical protein
VIQQHQQLTQALQSPQYQQAQQNSPEQAKLLVDEGQKTIDAGLAAIEKVKAKPNIDQVLEFIKNNRTKAFSLDIETDSTVMIDENGEKERRGEFVTVLSGMLAQIGQMVTATPESAEFCGELLKFSTAPFRAGRGLEGAIDNMIEMMKQQQDKPKGDDPVTAQNKTALQIEQMKDATNKEKIKSEEMLKRDEMKQRDAHERAKIASAERLKMAELKSRQGDDRAKAQQDNLKLVHSREEHQMSMAEMAEKRRTDAQKAEMQRTAQQNKMRADEQRASDQRASQAFKLAQPPRGPIR